MKIKNLTLRPVIFLNDENEEILRVEPVEPVFNKFRVERIPKDLGAITVDGVEIDVVGYEYGEKVHMLEPEDDTIFIVSISALNACPERKDFFITDKPVHDKNRNIIGWRNLTRLNHI